MALIKWRVVGGYKEFGWRGNTYNVNHLTDQDAEGLAAQGCDILEKIEEPPRAKTKDETK